MPVVFLYFLKSLAGILGAMVSVFAALNAHHDRNKVKLAAAGVGVITAIVYAAWCGWMALRELGWF